jgi:hypothetical protein
MQARPTRILPSTRQSGNAGVIGTQRGTVRFLSASLRFNRGFEARGCEFMYDIIYLVGLVVVVMFILSALGLR